MVRLNGERLRRFRASVGQKYSTAKSNLQSMREERERKRAEKEARDMARLEKESAKLEARARIEELKAQRLESISRSRRSIIEHRKSEPFRKLEAKKLEVEEKLAPAIGALGGLKRYGERVAASQARSVPTARPRQAQSQRPSLAFGLNPNAPNLLLDQKKGKKKEVKLI